MTTNKSEVWFDALLLKNIDATDVEDLTQAEVMSREYVQKAFGEIRRIPEFGQSS